MRNFLVIACLTLAALVTFQNTAISGPFSLLPAKKVRLASSSQKVNTLKWSHDLKSAHAISVRTNRPMMVVFGADWCGFCKKMERTTFQDPQMVKYIESNFIPVHLDFDKDKKAAEVLGVKSLPTTVVLSPDVDLLGRYKGFADTEKKMSKQLQQSLQTQRKLATQN